MIEKFKTNAEVIENGDKYLYGNHVRMPISMERGEGVYVFDKDGNKYLDFVGGIAVNGLGHCHPAIVKCLQERAETILHCSNYFYNEPAVQTAKLIVENSCFDKVLFANSGAEANEGQIKLARKYAKDHGHPERFVVITMKNSFHGRTLATCTATGQYAVHRYFEPLPSGFRYAEFNNLQSVKDIMDEYVCAILTEPVQGEGGVRPASQEFLQGLRDLCDEKGILLMFDEVPRSAPAAPASSSRIRITVWSPIPAPWPRRSAPACPSARSAPAATRPRPSPPAPTAPPSPAVRLACALAATTLDVMINEGVIENARVMGEYFRDQMHKVIEKNHPKAVNEIRGLGMINGIQLNHPSGQPVVDLCFKDANVLINNTNGNVLRFVPPLITGKEEIDLCIKAVDDAMTKLGW